MRTYWLIACIAIGAVMLRPAPAAAQLAGHKKPQPAQREDFIVTREAFLRDLKLDRPQLAPVREALEAGDVDAAMHAYIAHFRTKDIASPLVTDWDAIDRNPGDIDERARDFVNGYIRGNYNVYRVPPEGIDWRNAPLVVLCSFHEFTRLSEALHHSDDPKYLRAIVEHGYSYMDAYPIDEFVGKDTTQGWVDERTVGRPWRWGTTAERPITWSSTLALIRRYPQVSDEELADLLHRLYQEVAYLRTQMKPYVDAGHNAGSRMILSMATACALFDDFKAADEWREFDVGLLSQYINDAYYPDGPHRELTIAYWTSTSRQMMRTAHALREADGIAQCEDRLKAMITALIGLEKPTGRLPSYGDLSARADPFYEPIFDWIGMPPWAAATALDQSGPTPPFTIWPLPDQDVWSGWYAMRSDWSPRARYLAIDGGPWGSWHAHGDKLSIVVTAHGEDFIIDPPSTKYHSNEPDAFLSRQQAGFLHNTITVDGVDEYMESTVVDGKVKLGPRESDKPIENTWQQGDDYTLFASSYSFSPVKPVEWERRVLFVGGEYWLMQDVLIGNQDAAAIEQNFQFDEDVEITFEDDMTIATAPNGARLVIVPLDGGLKPRLTAGDKSPHTTYWYDGKPKQVRWYLDGEPPNHGRGWVGHGKKLYPAPAVTYVGDVDLPRRITVALIPLAPEQSLDDVPRITARDDAGATTWTLPLAQGRLEFVTSTQSCRVR